MYAACEVIVSIILSKKRLQLNSKEAALFMTLFLVNYKEHMKKSGANPNQTALPLNVLHQYLDLRDYVFFL